MTAPLTDAPVMLPAHVDTWCQTHPTPAPDPDVSLFLHGPQSGPADVQIIWRADLPTDLRQIDRQDLIDLINLVPPSGMEALPLPPGRARQWLRNVPGRRDFGEPEGVLADVEAVRDEEESRPGSTRRTHRVALRWRGGEDERTELVGPDEILPGDTLIVPASYGGCDRFGWDPLAVGVVSDVADGCALLGRWRPTLRLRREVIESWQVGPDAKPSLAGTVALRLKEAAASR